MKDSMLAAAPIRVQMPANRPQSIKTELSYEDCLLMLGILDLFFERVNGEPESALHAKVKQMANERIP